MSIVRRSIQSLPILLMLASVACKTAQNATQGMVSEPYVSDASSVPFDVEPVKRADDVIQMAATYTSQGKIARFTIELGKTTAAGTTSFPVKFGEGRFIAEPGSDASVLLVDLQKALEAKNRPPTASKLGSLPFTFAFLGEHQSQTPGGGFRTNPVGGWTAMKIFLGNDDQEAEVFLNFNLKTKKAQFSLKDADYGDLVLQQLAKVL